MKPKNFPARKKARQIGANIQMPVRWFNENLPIHEIETARLIRTKKIRG